MLKTRVKTAAVLTALAIPLLWFSYLPWVMEGFTIALGVCGVYELHRGTGSGKSLWMVLSLAAAVILPLVEIPHYIDILALVFPLILLCFLMGMLRIDEMSAPKAPVTTLLSLALVMFFSALPKLRQLPFGLLNLLMMVLVCVATDAAAYFIGRAHGRHKLAPSVSPKKTIEGALGGTVTAILAALLFCVIAELTMPVRTNYAAVVLYAVTTSVVGQMGDLSMSLVKRLVGLKDFSNLLPGHGGILDRFDSQAFAAPFTLIFIQSICPLFVK